MTRLLLLLVLVWPIPKYQSTTKQMDAVTEIEVRYVEGVICVDFYTEHKHLYRYKDVYVSETWGDKWLCDFLGNDYADTQKEMKD